MNSDLRNDHYVRWRGMVVQHAYNSREEHLDPMDDLMLWGTMQRTGARVGQNAIYSILVYLRDSGYLRFQEESDRFTGRTRIFAIDVTSKGCDLVERRITDPAVLIP